MRKHLYFCLILLLVSLPVFSQTDGITIETFLYATKGDNKLYLDKYDLPSSDKNKPCLIFAFGGGFAWGSRDAKHYKSYFEELAKHGFCIVSIDYRLGLKDLDAKKIESPIDIIPKLGHTINDCVEDLFDATNFIIEHQKEWGINKDKIITSGSSAGAITVLQAEYNICNKTQLSKKLPEGFNYAGVISFAGAILSMNGDLRWKNLPCPIQLFHGNADGNVPYDKLEFFNIGFYGSKHIVEHLDKMQSPYYFYDVINENHIMAERPMHQNINEILSFCKMYVDEKQELFIHTRVEKKDEEPKKKKFTIIDYVINNFPL